MRDSACGLQKYRDGVRYMRCMLPGGYLAGEPDPGGDDTAYRSRYDVGNDAGMAYQFRFFQPIQSIFQQLI